MILFGVYVKENIIVKKNKLIYYFIFSVSLHVLLIHVMILKTIKKTSLFNANKDSHTSIMHGVIIDGNHHTNMRLNQYKHKVVAKNKKNMIVAEKIYNNKTNQRIQSTKKYHKDIKYNNITKLKNKYNSKTGINIKSNMQKNDKLNNDIDLKNKFNNNNNKNSHNSNSLSIEFDNLLKQLTEKHAKNNINNRDNMDYNSLNMNLQIRKYVEGVKNFIENNFYNYSNYHGKNCELHLKFNVDKNIVTINNKYYTSNNQELCDTAKKLLQTLEIPKPLDKNIFNIIKTEGITLVFKL
uniref:TonB C-terminal domain-containing protein n=1 Tax=Candidatus Aschnera chinzeii TaxID=1485666 RepID=A0AAT9G4A8_9ENTR|nr:MAG: hypothetical protein ACHINZ_2320 [Candidatus Aschnera chinzeii]